MRTTQDGIDLIKRYEGFSATPYLCPSEKWTIGYGSTCDPDGNPITEDTAHIDEKTALGWLINEIDIVERRVENLLMVQLNDNQLSAVVSLAYNIGTGAFRESQTLLALNAGEHERMAKEWREWRKAGDDILQGLVKRREAELDMFFKEQ